jgi:hypothetical protein
MHEVSDRRFAIDAQTTYRVDIIGRHRPEHQLRADQQMFAVRALILLAPEAQR